MQGILIVTANTTTRKDFVFNGWTTNSAVCSNQLSWLVENDCQ